MNGKKRQPRTQKSQIKENSEQQWQRQKATLGEHPIKNLKHPLFGTNSLYKLPDARSLRPVKPPRPMRRRRRWGGSLGAWGSRRWPPDKVL